MGGGVQLDFEDIFYYFIFRVAVSFYQRDGLPGGNRRRQASMDRAKTRLRGQGRRFIFSFFEREDLCKKGAENFKFQIPICIGTGFGVAARPLFLLRDSVCKINFFNPL